MKIPKLLLLFILTLTISYSQNNTFKLGFTGAYPNYYDTSTRNINWSYYGELNLNTIQGWWIGDNPFGLETLGKLNQSGINLDSYFQPDTLRQVGYGRQQVNYAASGRDDRFTYNTVSPCGVPYQDVTWNNGQTVLFFDKNYQCNQQQYSGLVLSGVKENGFQSFSGVPYDPRYQTPFPGGGGAINNYYVKPRMRIDSAEAYSNPPKNVCRVIVKAYNGEIVDSITITTLNILNISGGNYRGQYLEEFFPSNANQLEVSADTITGINKGRPSYDPAYLDSCKVDYQIYWYGTVSFWIDYVKVMDESAMILFASRPNDLIIKQALKNKITRLQTNDPHGKMKGFYMEEIDYSNLACLKLLNDTLLPAWSGNNSNYKMIPLVADQSFVGYLRHPDWTYFYSYFDSIHVPIFMTDQYPFTGVVSNNPDWIPKLPNNISSTLSFPSYYSQSIKDDIQNMYNTGAAFVSRDAYNTQLQSRLTEMEGYLKYLFYPLCQQHNMDMYCVPQIIFWHYHDSNFWMREPMTSEISAEFGIDLCNGAMGILPYAYESWHSDSVSEMQIHGGSQDQYKPGAQTNFHYDMSLGASDFDNTYNWGFRKRELDVYGENNVCHSRGSGNLGFSSRPI